VGLHRFECPNPLQSVPKTQARRLNPVIRPSAPIRAGLFLLCTLAVGAQTTPTPIDTPTPKPKPRAPKTPKSDTPIYNTNLIVLDPAHGGEDKGATLAEDSFEKDANIALAERLRPLLVSRGFTVVYTHASASDDASADSRVEATNRNHPVACILLHASAAGHGVHLLTSALTPPAQATPGTDDPRAIAPWDTAQAAFIPQSLRLSNDLAAALNAARIPILVSRTSVRPIDSMTCPAIALELSPLTANGDEPIPASDSGYQTRVAETVTNALISWREQVIASSAAAQAARAISSPTPGAPATAKPAPKPKPKLVTPPVEVPAETSPSPAMRRAPAPVIRKNADGAPTPAPGPPQ
jgi:N-acetylmuramoyl-L-alanine amidase